MQYKIQPFWKADRETHRFGVWISDWNKACMWASGYAKALGIDMAIIDPTGELAATCSASESNGLTTSTPKTTPIIRGEFGVLQ
jgi:hypothetical protein